MQSPILHMAVTKVFGNLHPIVEASAEFPNKLRETMCLHTGAPIVNKGAQQKFSPPAPPSQNHLSASPSSSQLFQARARIHPGTAPAGRRPNFFFFWRGAAPEIQNITFPALLSSIAALIEGFAAVPRGGIIVPDNEIYYYLTPK